jgi:serine/threonine protein kinase
LDTDIEEDTTIPNFDPAIAIQGGSVLNTTQEPLPIGFPEYDGADTLLGEALISGDEHSEFESEEKNTHTEEARFQKLVIRMLERYNGFEADREQDFLTAFGRPIGGGGFSDVYMFGFKDKEYALKMYNPKVFTLGSDIIDHTVSVQELCRSVGVAVPKIYAKGIENTKARVCTVMDFIRGKDLDSRLVTDSRLRDSEIILQAYVSMANDLQKMHDVGVVHRDLKPENIMLGEPFAVSAARNRFSGELIGTRPFFIDFDLAVRIPEGAKEGYVVLSKECDLVPCTPDYVAPETFFQHRVMPASDVYAMGVLLYEICTGKMPCDKRNLFGMMIKKRNDSLKMVHRISEPYPSSLKYVIERCLEKDPADRFSSAAELAYEVEACAKNAGRVVYAMPGVSVPATLLDSYRRPRPTVPSE